MIIIITGPTAIGKSIFADTLATKINGEIINLDPFQFYKDIPILSGQPDIQKNPHHLYGIFEPEINLSVAKGIEMIDKIISNVLNRSKIPIIVSGSPMYIRRLIDGIINKPDIDPAKLKSYELMTNEAILNKINKYNYAHKIHLNDRYRLTRLLFLLESDFQKNEIKNEIKILDKYKIPIKKYLIFNQNRDFVYKQSNIKFDDMLKLGAIQEVENTVKKIPNYINTHYTIIKTIGFLHIAKYLQNEISFQEMHEKSHQNTRNFIKRQYTWFNNNFNDFEKIFYDSEFFKNPNLF